MKEDNSKPKSKTAKKVQITYDNPDKYKGPVVEGWPPNSDRYAHAHCYRMVNLRHLRRGNTIGNFNGFKQF